ncbi:hypothetical protein [Nonomuraea sp. NPDC049624]|uniref:hypothetical protein n=2 Tax=unclassified Nonomuraea TaxID=2593643 RepID=UPI0034465060
MPYTENPGPDHWSRAQPSVAEGFCPECLQPLTSRTMTVSTPDGQPRQITIPECVHCEVEWMPRHLFEPGAQEWVRFQRMDSVLEMVRGRDQPDAEA